MIRSLFFLVVAGTGFALVGAVICGGVGLVCGALACVGKMLGFI